MPERYEAIRDAIKKKLIDHGMTPAEAKQKAEGEGARIYNGTKKPNEKPVGGKD